MQQINMQFVPYSIYCKVSSTIKCNLALLMTKNVIQISIYETCFRQLSHNSDSLFIARICVVTENWKLLEDVWKQFRVNLTILMSIIFSTSSCPTVTYGLLCPNFNSGRCWKKNHFFPIHIFWRTLTVTAFH